MSRSLVSFFMILVPVVLLAACSGGANPVSPGTAGLPDVSARMPVYVSQVSDNLIAGTGVLGLYQVTIDPGNLTYEVNQVRTSSFVPNEYEIDLTTALTVKICKDCFRINSIGLAGNGDLLIDAGVKHPFPKITSLPAPKPQRPDLHIFDVQGIVIIDGKKSFSKIGVTLNPNFLINPDGYTTAFDSVIDSLGSPFTTPNANAHPFKIMSMGNYVNPGDEVGNYDMYSVNGYPNPEGLKNPTGFNVLPCGSGYKNTQFEIDPPTNAFSFFFAVTCSFGESAKGKGTRPQKRDNPIYLLPAFSKPEAWKVGVSIENNSLADNDNTSTAEVVIDVCDWQQACGKIPAKSDFDPSTDLTTTRNTLIKASGIKLLEVDIPGLNNPVDTSASVTPTGAGSYYNPRKYRITVNNDAFASEIPDPTQPPQFYGCVAVRDDLAGTINSIGGIDRKLVLPDSLFQISDYTTYQVFGISIFPPNDPPVPVIKATSPVIGPPFPISFASGLSLIVNGVSSYDTDGNIVLYEWDFDYDPITETFNTDYTNADPAVAANPPAWKMSNQYDEARKKYVALKVRDDGATPLSSLVYVPIELGPNKPPIADLGVSFYNTVLTAPYEFYAGEKVTLRPGALTWDDGQITTYQYDYIYDSVTPFFTVDKANTTGAPVMSPVQSQGMLDMATRVVDNGIPNKTNVAYSHIIVKDAAVKTPKRLNNPGSADVWLDNPGNHAIAVSSNYIVCAWRQTGTQADIFYSVSNNRGTTWSPQAVLNSVTTGTQRNVSLACRPSADVFYAVFESNQSGAYTINYAISNAGASLWSLQGVVAPATDTPSDPTIAVHTSLTRLYVAYCGLDALSRDAIFVRISPDNGTTWSSRYQLNTSTTGDRTDPDIAYDPGMMRVGVAWDDARFGSYYQIFFNWSDMTGAAWQASDVRVASSTTSQTDPSLSSRSGTWIMTFDYLAPLSDIYFTSSASGLSWGLPVDVTDNFDAQHNDSSVCVDRLGTIYAATTDTRETGNPSDRDVYVFKSLDGGVTWKRGVRIDSSPTVSNAFRAQIAGLIGASESGFTAMYESPDDYVYAVMSNAY